jgi:hypothetical protein
MSRREQDGSSASGCFQIWSFQSARSTLGKRDDPLCGQQFSGFLKGSMKRFLMVLGGLALVMLVIKFCGKWPEAIFRLRDDSPLPAWTVLPAGVSRDQVSVIITDYERTTGTSSNSGWDVRCEVRYKRWRLSRKIQTERGYGYWHPESLRKQTPGGTYPNWIVIEVKGIKEVYEHNAANDLLKIVMKPLE